MYFVTVKRPEYTLFSMSPSERFAVAVDEHNLVSFVVRSAAGDWEVLHQWKAADYSHTAFMASLRNREEPDDPRELLALLPEKVRGARH